MLARECSKPSAASPTHCDCLSRRSSTVGLVVFVWYLKAEKMLKQADMRGAQDLMSETVLCFLTMMRWLYRGVTYQRF